MSEPTDMEDFSKIILRELFAPEENVRPQRKAHREQRPDAVDHFSMPVLMERVAYLRKLAKVGDGSSSETLKEYPQHAIMLLYRSRSGIAEVHENFADLFFVLDGRGALVTGGTVVNATPVAPGEFRGDSIEDGARQELRAGDVAHVPAGTPHQMIVSGEKAISCLVMKIRQDPEKQ